MAKSPLPPGHYTGTIERVRKVRGKPAFSVHMKLDTLEGPVKLKGRVNFRDDEVSVSED